MAHMFKPESLGGFADGLYTGDLAPFRHVPFLLANDMTYLDDANIFIRQIASQKGASSKGLVSRRRRRGVSGNTLIGKARALENFFSYVEAKSLDWHVIDYDALLSTYDTDMARGLWSADGKPLAAKTINLRIDTACQFLTWAAEQGLRGAFNVDTEIRSREVSAGNSSHRTFEMISNRVGARRYHPSRLRLPTVEEINTWLDEVSRRRGPTKALACKAILNTNMRLEEVVMLRQSQVRAALDRMETDPAHVEDPDRLVDLNICYGTKGQRILGDPEKMGKPRTLRVRPAFMVELDRYDAKRRPYSVRKFRRTRPGNKAPQQFFLHDLTGAPITRGALYKAWHECKTLPFKGWSPHAGRHAWACFTLLNQLQRQQQVIEAITAAGATPTALLMQLSKDTIDLLIRPAMGHVDRATTDRYLDWVSDHLSSKSLRMEWSRYLDGDNE